MARVFLTSVQPPARGDLLDNVRAVSARIRSLAERCREHELTSDPERADVILLDSAYTIHGHLDPARLGIRQHPLRARYPTKTFVCDPDDDPCLLVPGVFASLDRRSADQRIHRAGCYLHQTEQPLMEYRRPLTAARHLFSFVGAPSTHPIRYQIMRLQCPRARIMATPGNWPKTRTDKDAYKQQFADSIHDSVFVLCPRGRGTSSMRLFQVLQAGRVPVIISDHWVPPAGPDWKSCSIRVPEAAIGGIPALLESIEPGAQQMALAARDVFETWFSKDHAFGHVIDWCLELKSANRDGPLNHLRLARHMCRPKAFKRYVVRPAIDRFCGQVSPFTRRHL